MDIDNDVPIIFLLPQFFVRHHIEPLGPLYRSIIKLIVIKCEINRTRDQIEPIEVSDSWVNGSLKFNLN
jgi:hypothetical protein